MIELLLVGDRRELPVDARHRVAADLQVQVGGALVDGELQQVVDVHGGPPMREDRSGLERATGRERDRRQPAVRVGHVALDDRRRNAAAAPR